MQGDPGREKLDDLSARIKKAGGEETPKTPSENASLGVGRLGFDFTATVMGCGAVGFLIDRQLNSRPWVMLGLVLAGFVVGFANLWRVLAGYEEGIGWRKKNEKGK
jgi:ATP synthase protein I